MKACIIQPPYSMDTAFSDEYFEFKLKMLDECDDSIDIIVLPEYSDVPCVTASREETLYYHNKYIGQLLDKCVETARRCSANVFVNALSPEEDGYYHRLFPAAQRQPQRHRDHVSFSGLPDQCLCSPLLGEL